MTASEKTRALVEGAMMAVIATIMGLTSIYLPILAFVTSFFIPIPIIILIRRYDLKTGLLSLLVTTLLLMMLSGNPLTGLLMAVQFGGIAIIFGLAFKNAWSPGKSILAGGLIFLLSLGVSMGVTFLITGINPFAIVDMMDTMRASFEPLIKSMQESGQFDELAKRGITEADFRNQLEQSVQLFIALIPSVIIITSFFSAYLNYIITRSILKKLQFSVTEMLPFREWRLPWFSIWVLIIGIGLTILGDQFTSNLVQDMGKNLTMAGILVFFVMGLAFAVFFFQQAKMAKVLKFLLFFFLLINLPAAVWFLTFLGLGDTLFNMRRLIIKEEEKK